jgi:hypothetical protein
MKATVVLLHGLGLGGWAMLRLAGSLRTAGYDVLNLTYRSRRVPVEILAQDWLPDRLRRRGLRLDHGPDLHFVTHSMGGLVLRSWLEQAGPVPVLKRAVMIAPPNHGTRLVDHLGDWWLFRLFTGVNGHRLGTKPDSLPAQLGPWPQLGPELGIIAGNFSLNPWLAYHTGRPGDGKVTVENTKLAGMSDHLVLTHSHTWLQYRREPIDQVLTFLREGRFSR